MCGIVGIYHKRPAQLPDLQPALNQLSRRGPDSEGQRAFGQKAALGHRRLSVIDTSDAALQPMAEPTGRYHIVFNGEIYNYRELAKELESKGHRFQSASDTEVLLHGYMEWGAELLPRCNGFFAFAVFDTHTEDLFLARDRFGIKPLLVFEDDDRLIFASELKALMPLVGKLQLDYTAISTYFHLNYIPAPLTVFRGIRKVYPGHALHLQGTNISDQKWYQLPVPEPRADAYADQQKELVERMDRSVRRRLVSDVPLGAFLSGGIDSSVVVAMASRHVEKLRTFSIGFVDNPYFDETHYAELVAQKFKTEHTVFRLESDEMLERFDDVLAYLDDPFADSSALAVNVLSELTRKHVTVALSGDGGDELFAGYHKHLAEWMVQHGGFKSKLVKAGGPIWGRLPQSRHSRLGNKVRQLHRFAEGARMTPADRYWRWCGFDPAGQATAVLRRQLSDREQQRFLDLKQSATQHFGQYGAIRDVLFADVGLVLPGDMLAKVDFMSMSHGLEVRVPFLDHELVEFAFGLPDEARIGDGMKKRIVQDAFRHLLPGELYNRPKKGFEVPLLDWLRGPLRSRVDAATDTDMLRHQGVFEPKEVQNWVQALDSRNPGDSHARVYAMLVFQEILQRYEANLS